MSSARRTSRLKLCTSALRPKSFSDEDDPNPSTLISAKTNEAMHDLLFDLGSHQSSLLSVSTLIYTYLDWRLRRYPGLYSSQK